MKSIIIKAAKEAGKIILMHYGNYGKLKFKNPRSLLTKVDLLADEKIKEIISKKYPKHNFLTEESGFTDKGSEYTWIIDPIDGTTNFVAKIPEFAVSIALAKRDEILMGAVYNPCTNEMYFAEKGKGSYLNNKKLHVSKKNNLEHCILGFSLPNDIGVGKKTLSILGKNFGMFRAFRNFGSAALNLCYVANARFDLYFSLNIKAWDIAAAKLIVEEARGKATNFDNKKWNINDQTIAASNGILHNEFIKLLK